MRTTLRIPMLIFLVMTTSLIQAQSVFDSYMSDPDEPAANNYFIYVGRFANSELWSFNRLNNLDKMNSKMIADSSDVINGPYRTQTEAENAWISMKISGFTKARVYQGAFEITPMQAQAEAEIAATETEEPVYVEPVQENLPMTITTTTTTNSTSSKEHVPPPVFPESSAQKNKTDIVYTPPPSSQQEYEYQNLELDQLIANADSEENLPIERGIDEYTPEMIANADSEENLPIERGVDEKTPDVIAPINVPETICEVKQLYFVQLSAMPDINGEPHQHLASRYNVYVFEDEKDHLFKILVGPFEKKEEANQTVRELKKTPKYAKVFVREMCYDIGQLNNPVTQNDKQFMQLTVLYNQQ
ncbi:MAG: hypothetical protein IPM47_02600 [Sphingobacteriales bacterium]|nr:MAG: hypothetical protein IPM47_02600 [Sphingobacteriales bacterium]